MIINNLCVFYNFKTGFLYMSQAKLKSRCILSLPTRVVTKINGHRDKWSSKLSNVSSVNKNIAHTKQQHILKPCLPFFLDLCFIVV